MAVIAPAGPVDPADYQAGLAILAGRYRVVQQYDADDPTSASAGGLPYLAGDDASRLRQLNRALRDPRVEAIFCARGGYGSMRILDGLDAEALARRKPPLVGFSDCTALHAWAARHGVPSIHGPVVTQLGRLHTDDVQALFDLLEGRALPHLTGLQPLTRGRATGPLFGGNLSLLSHLLGTPYLPELRGGILLLEEVDEVPYRIDRMLTHLRLCGLLHHVAGVVAGAFIGCDASQGRPQLPVAARTVLEDRLGDLGIPVVLGAPVGHGDRNIALPLGLPVSVDADAGTLSVKG